MTRKNMGHRGCGRAVAALLFVPCLSQAAPTVQTFDLIETKRLIGKNAKVEPATFKGRKAVRLTNDSADDAGFAVLEGTDFEDGVIEADVAVKVITPPGLPRPGFIGIAFRLDSNATGYELFYVRPGNSQSNDQARRNHSVQYAKEPEFGWYKLRREWPSIYEAYAELEPEAWTKLKIEVTGREAKLFLNDSTKPSLVVDGLKGETLRGAVALWGFSGEESYFANVRITNLTPEPVKKGGEVSGRWDFTYLSDVGNFSGWMDVARDGNTMSGKCSGFLGENRAVTGTWRNGYVELSFEGEWPRPNGQNGKPIPATAALEGWIDGDSVKGRMRVEGIADGTWSAARKK